jgi:hypothetical protein
MIGRRAFITLLGGAGVAARGTRAAAGEAANYWLPGFKHCFDLEPLDRRYFEAVARTRLD